MQKSRLIEDWLTEDGSDFIVADTKTIRHIAFAVSMKIYSLIRQVVHG